MEHPTTAGKNSTPATNAPKGESYNFSDQELIRQLVKSRMSQKHTLEYENLDGYVLPPRTQFSMLKKPAFSIKYGKLVFNMACIRLFEDIEYILPLVHPDKKRLTVVMCPEEQSASVAWAKKRQKDNAWVNRDITSEEFVHNLYELMKWNPTCRYKVLGRIANSQEGLVLVFDLEEAIMFDPLPAEVIDHKTGTVKKRQISYYPDIYKSCIGKSYMDYKKNRQDNLFEPIEEYTERNNGLEQEEKEHGQA